MATHQWGLFQIPFFSSSVLILQPLHSENLRGNNISSVSHRLEDESRTGRLGLILIGRGCINTIVISERFRTAERALIYLFLISLCWPSSERTAVTQSAYVTVGGALSLNQEHEK